MKTLCRAAMVSRSWTRACKNKTSRSITCFALSALFLIAAAAAQVAGNPPAQPPRPPATATAPASDQTTTFTVDVKLVNVFVTVLDKNGSPVGTLKRDDFQLLEDGTPQKLALFSKESELPLSIVLAVDASLSTRKDLKLELESGRRFVHSILRSQDSLALYQFSERVDELVPFTANLQRIDRGFERVHVGAATALYDAVYLGSRALSKRQGRKVLVMITDGGDTLSQVGYQDALRAAQQSEALVYSIIIVPIEASAGRDIGGEHALIQLSTDTGGKFYYASGIEQLDAAFHQVSEELRTQYLLAYYPVHRYSSSDFRRIEVKVKSEDSEDPLTTRHRSGYYTSKDE